MPLNLKSLDKKKPAFFRFKQLNGQYLLTNDIGKYCFLTHSAFEDFLSGTIKKTCPDKYQELQNNSFIRDTLDLDELAKQYASKNMFLFGGTGLHIIVVTLRCDHKCIYCQAVSGSLKDKSLDMDIPTAQRVVDRILESSSHDITIEFQGGEPLINWDTVKFIIKYAQEKNKNKDKKLVITLVSNLTYLTEEILDFLVANDVAICTSLDGPEYVHNKNRFVLTKGKNSYKNTKKWLKIIKNRLDKAGLKHKPNALLTLTKFSLSYPEEIVNEYIRLDLDCVHLRPANTFSFSKKVPNALGYSGTDFVNFYKKALDYIIKINLNGKIFYERTAIILLSKILTDRDPNYLDIRSPCGAGIGQMAYNFNGDVYVCDEGRMLSRKGDESFRIGNVTKNCYSEMISQPTVKAMCIASCLDNLPGCSQCAYKPYCGICPLLNYTEKGHIFIQQPNNERCRVQRDILDYLFDKIRNNDYKKIFEGWIDYSRVGKSIGRKVCTQ